MDLFTGFSVEAQNKRDSQTSSMGFSPEKSAAAVDREKLAISLDEDLKKPQSLTHSTGGFRDSGKAGAAVTYKGIKRIETFVDESPPGPKK